MDADTRLAQADELVAAYQRSHSHPNAFACCSAHAVADLVPDLLSLVAERDVQIAYLIAAEPTLDDDQPGAPQ